MLTFQSLEKKTKLKKKAEKRNQTRKKREGVPMLQRTVGLFVFSFVPESLLKHHQDLLNLNILKRYYLISFQVVLVIMN